MGWIGGRGKPDDARIVLFPPQLNPVRFFGSNFRRNETFDLFATKQETNISGFSEWDYRLSPLTLFEPFFFFGMFFFFAGQGGGRGELS